MLRMLMLAWKFGLKFSLPGVLPAHQNVIFVALRPPKRTGSSMFGKESLQSSC